MGFGKCLQFKIENDRPFSMWYIVVNRFHLSKSKSNQPLSTITMCKSGSCSRLYWLEWIANLQRRKTRTSAKSMFHSQYRCYIQYCENFPTSYMLIDVDKREWNSCNHIINTNDVDDDANFNQSGGNDWSSNLKNKAFMANEIVKRHIHKWAFALNSTGNQIQQQLHCLHRNDTPCWLISIANYIDSVYVCNKKTTQWKCCECIQ